MNGFVITLSPKDESGRERNRDYYHVNQDGLPAGGKVEILDGDVLKCRWEFSRVIPDFSKKSFLKRWSASLDEAKKRADNFDYKVEFI